MFGLLNIDKPTGITSRQVVDRVERLVRPAKAGHAGTLDPLATGVLVICVGPATRLIEYVQRMPKKYRATFLFGQSSASDDTETEVIRQIDATIPSHAELMSATRKLVGRILQRPPAYSAVHVGGQRAYRLARRGKAVELEARPVEVHEIRVLRYEYPELELEISCGSGTYVRSIGRDLAASVGTTCVMSALVRTAIGLFQVEQACPLESLSSETLHQWLQPPLKAVSMLTEVTLEADEAVRVLQGQSIRRTTSSSDAELAAIDEQGTLVAVLKQQADGTLRAVRAFPRN